MSANNQSPNFITIIKKHSPRTTRDITKDSRFSAKARHDGKAIHPKSTPNVKTSNIFSSACIFEIC